MYVYSLAGMCIMHVSSAHRSQKRVSKTWNWSYGWFWGTLCMLGVEPRSFARVAHAAPSLPSFTEKADRAHTLAHQLDYTANIRFPYHGGEMMFRI